MTKRRTRKAGGGGAKNIKRWILPGLVVVIIVAIMMIWGYRRSNSPDGPKGKVTIGQTSWTVEIANTADQRYQGLSDRKELPAGHGMLFMYPDPRTLTSACVTA